jgi:hypothetical protein
MGSDGSSFFSSTRGASCSAYDGTINTPKFLIEPNFPLKGPEDIVQSAIAIPFIKQPPNCLPCTKFSWQTSPGGTGTENPKYSMYLLKNYW